MIIVAIVALCGVVLAAISVVFGNGLPALPDSVMQLSARLIQIVRSGSGLFWSFVHPAPVKAMLTLTLAAVTLYEGYKLVMWVMKKVPMFGVDD